MKALSKRHLGHLQASLGSGLTVFIVLALPLLTGLLYFGLDLSLLDLVLTALFDDNWHTATAFCCPRIWAMARSL